MEDVATTFGDGRVVFHADAISKLTFNASKWEMITPSVGRLSADGFVDLGFRSGASVKARMLSSEISVRHKVEDRGRQNRVQHRQRKRYFRIVGLLEGMTTEFPVS